MRDPTRKSFIARLLRVIERLRHEGLGPPRRRPDPGAVVTTIEALLQPVLEQLPDFLVGWPDDTVSVYVCEPEQLRAELAAALSCFHDFWRGDGVAVDIDVVASAQPRLDIRCSRRGERMLVDTPPQQKAEATRTSSQPWSSSLALIAQKSGGNAYGSYGASSFGLGLLIESTGPALVGREHFAEFADREWDVRYREKLDRTSWTCLRGEAYRFAKHATRIANWARSGDAKRVLIPSVGLCVDPWLFAHRGLSVVATDISPTALQTIQFPERLPRVYGAKAKQRWDVREIGAFAGAHPWAFDPMPDIARLEVAAELRDRIQFAVCDWTKLPLPDGCIDVVFATNALPRGDADLRRRVLEEWARVTRPGGLVFSAMHNAGFDTAAEFFQGLGWKRVDALDGERVPSHTMFHEWLSSG